MDSYTVETISLGYHVFREIWNAAIAYVNRYVPTQSVFCHRCQIGVLREVWLIGTNKATMLA